MFGPARLSLHATADQPGGQPIEGGGVVAFEVAEAAAPERHNHRAAELVGARGAYVNHAGGRHAVDAPARRAQPFLPVHLLTVHEVAFIKQTHLLNSLAAHHQRGAQDEVHSKGLARTNQVLAIASVQAGVQNWPVEPAGRRIEVKRNLEEAGKAERAMLKAPVRVGKPGAAAARARVVV